MPGRLLVAWALPFLAACTAFMAPREVARQDAYSAGFVQAQLPDPYLKAFLRRSAIATRRLTIYLEGDGAPWPWPDQPPVDPTPLKHTVLGMAKDDSTDAVAYLGRPCQHLESAILAECNTDWWTQARFGADVIAATDRAIDALKRASGATSIALVGYSGGGTLASLAAAGRSDIACLVTLAAPLDIDAWTDAIGVSRLVGSRNPIDSAGRLGDLKQTHVRGKEDRLVPAASTNRFLAKVPSAQVIDLDGVDHHCCWREVWSRIRTSTCLGQAFAVSGVNGKSSAAAGERS